MADSRTDHWREDFSCYASQWGFRCASEIANLIDMLRDEHRAKYGCDYRLRKTGKNRFLVTPGKVSDYGVSYAIQEAVRFDVTVTRE